MKFHSTRGGDSGLSVSEAMVQGLATDGGLLMPDTLPACDWRAWPIDMSYPDVAIEVLRPFFEGDALLPVLSDICHEALSFPVPLTSLNDTTYLMELYHGPTLSFKDIGARFLAACLSQLSLGDVTTILVATSGDTGSAVASAFHGKANIRVMVLFPEGQISQRQQQQITCWGDNVLAVAVKGNFDDCQCLVKSALADTWWQQHTRLNTSNSINVGRLLPQMTYYAFHSWQWMQKTQQPARFIVPSGNLGNVTAAHMAKQVGFPIEEIVMSLNANAGVKDYLSTGEFHPQASIATLANAMDVGDPSNLERLQAIYGGVDALRQHTSAISASDDDIRDVIAQADRQCHRYVCPHTATACYARHQLSDKPWLIAATADPCKFEQVLQPVLGREIPPTPALQALLSRPQSMVTVPVDGQQLKEQYQAYFLS